MRSIKGQLSGLVQTTKASKQHDTNHEELKYHLKNHEQQLVKQTQIESMSTHSICKMKQTNYFK